MMCLDCCCLLRTDKSIYRVTFFARIFVQVVDAVHALHNSKPPLIHRDLKLENLLIDKSCTTIKLCDFGSATSETFKPTPDW